MTTSVATSNITPFLWFEGNAEEAAAFYISIFPNGGIDKISRYEDDSMPGGKKGLAMMVEFHIDGQEMMALNGGAGGNAPLESPLPGSIALFVSCETQEKVDRLWEALSDGGRTMRCGWLADKFGVVWNIVPNGLGEYIGGDDAEGAARAMQAMFSMDKLDLAALRAAYEGTQ